MDQPAKPPAKARRRRSRIQIGADDLPVLDPLCGLQAAMAEAYSDVLARVIAHHKTLEGVKAQAVGIMLERLLHDAAWAVTEVRKPPAWKLLRQRYISEAVVVRWREVGRREHFTQRDFFKDSDGGNTLVHEHVVQREGIGKGLRELTLAEELHQLLRTSVACVVTVVEHDRLTAGTGESWARYADLTPPIRVYDRLERTWRPEPPLALAPSPAFEPSRVKPGG